MEFTLSSKVRSNNFGEIRKIVWHITANSIALTSMDMKGITLHPLHGVFAAVHRITLPRGLLCKTLSARWRCSDVRYGMDMVMGMRIWGDCYADEAREATSLGGVKDVWSLLFNWRSFWVCLEAQCIDVVRIRIILEEVCDSLWMKGNRFLNQGYMGGGSE